MQINKINKKFKWVLKPCNFIQEHSVQLIIFPGRYNYIHDKKNR